MADLEEHGPYAIGDSREWSIFSETVGDTYSIAAAWPAGEPPENGWPAIFLLDGRSCFGTCVEAMRRMSRRSDATGVKPMAVIGIACASHGDNAGRQRDFTMPAGSDNSGEARAAHGRADLFLAFIQDELKPALAARLPLDASRQALLGHSLAGYFALWVLANHARSFSDYAAISPSIWWDRDGLAGALATPPPGEPGVFLAAGEWEEDLPPWQAGLAGSADALDRRRRRAMIGNAREMAQKLQAMPGERAVHFSMYDGEDHASILSRAIPRVLRFVS